MYTVVIVIFVFLIARYFVFNQTETFTDQDTQIASEILNFIQHEDVGGYVEYLQFLVNKGNVYKNLNNHEVYFTFRTLKKIGQLNLDAVKRETHD